MLPVSPVLPRRERAFTLLEITVAVFLIMLMLAVAIPSFSGQLARQKLQGSFDRFDALAAAAQKRSVAENRPYALVWSRDDGVVGLYPADIPASERKRRDPAATLAAAGHYTLVRDAALTTRPANVWTFWPTGNCEPVGVRYEGPGGHWEAVYNPLSAKATINTFIAQ